MTIYVLYRHSGTSTRLIGCFTTEKEAKEFRDSPEMRVDGSLFFDEIATEELRHEVDPQEYCDYINAYL